MAKQTKLIFGSLLFALWFVNLAVAIFSDSQKLLYWSSCAFNAPEDGKEWLITEISRDDQPPILHVNDQILEVRGLPAIPKLNNPGDDLPIPPGSQLTLVVRCMGELHEVVVQTYGAPFMNWLRSISAWFINASFLLTGLVILLMKADDRQAWLLALMLGAFPGLFNYYSPEIPAWLFAIAIFARAISYIFLPLFVHFFSTFPRPLLIINRYPKMIGMVYGLFLFIIFPHFILMRGYQMFGWAALGWLSTLRKLLSIPGMSLVFIFLVGGIVALLLNYRQAARDDRRKLHIVVLGCSLGFFNLLLIVAFEVLKFPLLYPRIYEWAQLSLQFTLILIPASFAYAIIKHQVIPISLIIRRGMRYVLVSRGSVLLEIALFSLLLSVILTVFFKWLFDVYHPKNLDSLGMTIGVISATVGIVAWNVTRRMHHKYLAPIIDRKFFRQTYDSHQIITGLAESLRSTSEQPKLLEEVATKIQSALQTESVTILLREAKSDDFKSSYYCEYNLSNGCVVKCEHDFRLAAEARVVTSLSGLSKCREVRLLPLPDNEVQILRQMKAELLLPLSGKEQMLGIIALGPRLGDLPFSREDEELLMSVANPVALAIENSRLVNQMIEDARRREEIEAENEARAKELEEARQLQLSMLPKSVPQLPHLEIAVYMKPATEVGGDYYDFYLSSDGTLTIAVGDATGHGLKAGTVVTAMKSLFHTHALNGELLGVLAQSSRALKAMNLRSLFMALTLVKLKGYEMRIASAGMPSTLLYHHATDAVEEILMKTMPLGSMRDYPYREQSIVLQSGDVVVLMSDGFPERFNGDGEMLGFEKGAEVLRSVHGLTAGQIVTRFIQVEEHWAKGFAQNDDVTFVILKVK